MASVKILCQQIFVAQGWCICCWLFGGVSGGCRAVWIEGFPGFGWALEEVIGCHICQRIGAGGDGRFGGGGRFGGFGSCSVLLRGFLFGQGCSGGLWGWLLHFPERSPARRPTPAESLRANDGTTTKIEAHMEHRNILKIRSKFKPTKVRGQIFKNSEKLWKLWNKRVSPRAASLLHTVCWPGGARVSMALHPLWSYSWQIPTHTHTDQAKQVCTRSRLLNSRAWFLSCLPHSGRRGHRAHSALCVPLWHMWSSSCQISSWTWNLRPPSGRHPGNKMFLAPETPPRPTPVQHRSHYLSGGVADSVEAKQVRRVRHGVVLGDGQKQGTL